MRYSTLVSILLSVLPFIFWIGFCVSSCDRFVLWRQGEAGILLPIEKYESREEKQGSGTRWERMTNTVKTNTVHTADVSVRLNDGNVLVIPGKTVGLDLIQASRQGKVGVVVLPQRPRIHHIEGYSPGLLMEWLISSVVTFVSLAWFGVRRASG